MGTTHLSFRSKCLKTELRMNKITMLLSGAWAGGAKDQCAVPSSPSCPVWRIPGGRGGELLQPPGSSSIPTQPAGGLPGGRRGEAATDCQDHQGGQDDLCVCVSVFTIEGNWCVLGMGVRDIFKARQLSSQSFFQQSCQGNCQVNCATENSLRGNCQVNYFSKNFFKAIVKSIELPKNYSRQLSSQLFGETLFNFVCLILWFLGQFWSIMVGVDRLWLIVVNYR